MDPTRSRLHSLPCCILLLGGQPLGKAVRRTVQSQPCSLNVTCFPGRSSWSSPTIASRKTIYSQLGTPVGCKLPYLCHCPRKVRLQTWALLDSYADTSLLHHKTPNMPTIRTRVPRHSQSGTLDACSDGHLAAFPDITCHHDLQRPTLFECEMHGLRHSSMSRSSNQTTHSRHNLLGRRWRHNVVHP